MNPISIRDWSGHDRAQYFSGAYVMVNTAGQQVVARIDGFERDDRVSITTGGRRMSVDIDAIEWDGLPPRRCVATESQLFFVSPLGARTTRKPITRGNLGMVIINTNGDRTISNREPQQSVVELYLRGSLYPESVDEAVYMVHHNVLGALSPHLGYCRIDREIYDEDEDTYRYDRSLRLYRDSVLIFKTECVVEFCDHIRENWEEYTNE